MSDEAKSRTYFSIMFTFLSIGSKVARVVTFGKNCFLLLASLKFVTFVTTLPKVVTVPLDY